MTITRIGSLLTLTAGLAVPTAWADDAAPADVEMQEVVTQDAGPSTSVDQTAQAADDGFDNDVDRLSYAIGMDIGNSFKGQSIDINPEMLAQGMQAVYTDGDVRLSDQQAMAAIQKFQQDMQAKQMQQMMQEQEAAMSKNTAEAETFLAENKDKEGVQVTESGLQYLITEKGDGTLPGPQDQVTVHYRGQLIDGEVFDSSYDNGDPVTFGIDQVIPGFGEGLQLMPVGSKGKLFIPGDIAYGMQGGPGGPNATLIFDVEVIDTQAPADNAEELPALGD